MRFSVLRRGTIIEGFDRVQNFFSKRCSPEREYFFERKELGDRCTLTAKTSINMAAKCRTAALGIEKRSLVEWAKQTSNLPSKSCFCRPFCFFCLATAQKIAHVAHSLSRLGELHVKEGYVSTLLAGAPCLHVNRPLINTRITPSHSLPARCSDDLMPMTWRACFRKNGIKSEWKFESAITCCRERGSYSGIKHKIL